MKRTRWCWHNTGAGTCSRCTTATWRRMGTTLSRRKSLSGRVCVEILGWCVRTFRLLSPLVGRGGAVYTRVGRAVWGARAKVVRKSVCQPRDAHTCRSMYVQCTYLE